MGIVAVLVTVVVMGASVFSSAAFTATTANAANSFGTAVDWMPPSVTLGNPGPTVKGTVALTAEASDAESGIRNVVIQYAPAATGVYDPVHRRVRTVFLRLEHRRRARRRLPAARHRNG